MQIIQAAKAIVPEFHAFSDDDKRYHIGATWVSDSGLKDHHNLELRYTRNSEELAVTQGEEQLDGSWMYEEPNGTKHTISKARFDTYIGVKKKHADQYADLKNRMKNSGINSEIIDTEPAPA